MPNRALVTSYEVVFFCNMMRADGEVRRVGNILETRQGDKSTFGWFGDPNFEAEPTSLETWPELRRPADWFDAMCRQAERTGIKQYLDLFSIPSALYMYKDPDYHG